MSNCQSQNGELMVDDMWDGDGDALMTVRLLKAQTSLGRFKSSDI